MKDQVTLGSAEDFERRCTAIGKERRNAADLQDAMHYLHFKNRMHRLLDALAAEHRQGRPQRTSARISVGTPDHTDLCQAVDGHGCINYTAEAFGRRCRTIGFARNGIASLQAAMSHRYFKNRMHSLLDELAAEQRQRGPLVQRTLARISVGTHSHDLLRQAVCEHGDITGAAEDIYKLAKLTGRGGEVDLVDASNEELGFAEGCTVAQTYEAGEKLGWELCSPEDAAQYLIGHGADVERGESLHFAMGYIENEYHNCHIFFVERWRGELLLHACHGHPNSFYNGSTRWVFRRK